MAIIIAVLYTPKTTMLIGARLNNNFLYQVLCEFTDLNTLEPKYVVTIGGVAILITYIVIVNDKNNFT